LERKNLWAPWRIGYIKGLSEKRDCFICDNIKNPANDSDNFVLWRTASSLVMLNRFPYNNGHLLLAPVRHIGGLDELNDSEMLELTKLIATSQKVLTAAIKPHGFNVGMNFGRCAGAFAYSYCSEMGRRYQLYGCLRRYRYNKPGYE
jgi:ATP adenylyltransferase